MLYKLVGLGAFLGAISLSGGLSIAPNGFDGVFGFVKIGSNYYFIEDKVQKNWYDAYESCRRMKADLVAFNNLEELKEINQYLLKANEGKEFWTAGTDLAKQGEHIWFSNGQRISSDLFRIGEPNNQNNNEHCDNMWISSTAIGLNDDGCGKSYYYICQAPDLKQLVLLYGRLTIG
nr:C-type lectin 37Da-like [Drosophila takahashii]